MQKRHLNKEIYFKELANTSREFYIDYVNDFITITPNISILEIGCGEGGNLLPFAEIGCKVQGIDIAKTKIENARDMFQKAGYNSMFYSEDFFHFKTETKFDLIIIHDVIEHIDIKKKGEFIRKTTSLLKANGIVFWGFPAWQMPFGGHQQMCRNKICSKLPFIHLLPNFIYKSILKLGKERQAVIDALIETKRDKVTIEAFETLLENNGQKIKARKLWFINPHYKQKFNLKPRELYKWIGKIGYIRNYFSTSCFYISCKS